MVSSPLQAPLVEMVPKVPDGDRGEASPRTAAVMKMRSRGKVRSLRQTVELIDPVTSERIDGSRDALLKKALLSQGVELQQLLPRAKEDFGDPNATPEIIEARFTSFERMRHQLVDTVLEARRQLQLRAEGRRQARAAMEEQDSDVSLGMESPEALLQREQEHMQRVLAAAHARIEKEKTMEKEQELRAQEMIKESRAFHEWLVEKAAKHEKDIEQKRYKTELSRQSRNAKRVEQDEADLAEARRLAEVRAEKTKMFEETNALNKLEATDKALEFARGRAVKLKRIKKVREEQEASLVAKADEIEAKLDASEKMRTQTMELKQATMALQNEETKRRAAQKLAERQMEEAAKRAATAEEWETRWEDHVSRAQKIKERKEGEIRQRQLRSIQAGEEAEKRRNELQQQVLDQKMKTFEERAASKQLRSQEQYEKALEEKRLKNELGKLRFATKRVLVERQRKKSEYEREMRQQEIDRKDAQTRALKEAKEDLRERRARQSRNFFVQQRKMAEVSEKELQYLRFFGRESGELKATSEEVEHQMTVTARLLEGVPSATNSEETEEEQDHFTALSSYHKSLLETGREWLLSSGSMGSSRKLPPVALSPR